MKKLSAAVAALVTVAGSGATLGVVTELGSAPAGAASVNPRVAWSQVLPDAGSPIALASPILGNLDGQPAALVGDRAGKMYALHLSDGSEVPGWPVAAGAPIDAALATSGSTVYAGEGWSNNQFAGGLAAYNAGGGRLWFYAPPATPGSSQTVGIDSSPSVANLQGQTDLVSGSMGQYTAGVNAGNGAPLAGFPWFQADSNFSTPATGDVDRNGRTEIVEGGDSTYGNSFNQQYYNGGHIRILTANAGVQCVWNINHRVQSSPAIGQFLSGGGVGIAVGSENIPGSWSGGQFYPGPSNGDQQVVALDSGCNVRWTSTLDGMTGGSPSLIAADPQQGALQVVEGTNSGPGSNYTSGSVWVLNGATGAPIWHTAAMGGILGSVVSIDLGGGHQDLVAATVSGVEIMDGTTGAVLWQGLQGNGFQNSPLVTDDPNGTVGITVAGYNSNNAGVVFHLELPRASGTSATEAGAWPMFHHDPQLTGNSGIAPPVVSVPCRPPSSRPAGYWLGAADGGIFTFGNVPFCGSTGNIALNKPVVGMAGTRDAGGYWLVASDGGIFTFGDAAFHGSTGNIRLNQPIVGMAATPDGQGYWLVAADGGIFSFGDARFYGSTGNIHLNQPIVGMASTADGRGYWLVASDGGIFSFGDATFHGSTGNIHLNQPVVRMAATPDGQGYWLVAADGGIFTFGDARFYGSTGNVRLNRPVIGMQATADGRGYWLYAGDGGIFTFGDAPFYGSTGNVRLAQPIVSMAGY